MSIEVTLYKRPFGHKEQITCTKIHLEDEQWFKKHNAKLSMEESDVMGVVCYADVGIKEEDGTPVEAIELSGARSCAETLHALRKQCEQLLANQGAKA